MTVVISCCRFTKLNCVISVDSGGACSGDAGGVGVGGGGCGGCREMVQGFPWGTEIGKRPISDLCTEIVLFWWDFLLAGSTLRLWPSSQSWN